MKKQLIGYITAITGVILLGIGATFLVLKINENNRLRDGEFLVASDAWTLESSDSVSWMFTEVGKGKLTTNNHINDYEFLWSLEGDKLKLEISYLEPLEVEYSYILDQSSKTLSLTDDAGTVKLISK